MDVDKHYISMSAKVFSNIEDLKQCQAIYNSLKTIYTHHPSNILQEIAEFSIGIIKSCNNELCQDDVLLLNENNHHDHKNVFCQQCTSKLTQCWYEFDDRYGNYYECEQQFVKRQCECSRNVEFCSRHRFNCRECGDVCCTNSHSGSWSYEKWKCATHRSVHCVSCKQRFCEAKDGGNWCRGCGYVCSNCIEYKCKCRIIQYDDDNNKWSHNCIKHKNCQNHHGNHLGVCDCSKECTLKLCCCQDEEIWDMLKENVIYFQCLVCGNTKKYNYDHLPKERRFVCIGDEYTEHGCGHGVCLDCKMNKTAYPIIDKINQECRGCGTKCDHWR